MSFRIAAPLAFLAGVLCYAHPAQATTCTIPNTFTANTSAVAAQVNANFSSLQTCGNSIDNTNIGSAGLFASQLKPTNSGQASFGGTQAYTFPAQLSASGTITSNPGANTGFVSTAGDAQAQLLFNSNNGANQTVIGQNTSAGYPAFAVAKLSSGGSFQQWLMGMDESGNTTINGTLSTGGAATVPGLTVNGAISATGTIGATGNITSGGQINSSGTMTNTGMTANGNIQNNGAFNSTGVVAANGNLTTNGQVVSSLAIQRLTGGVNYGVPYNANETTGSVSNHLEHGIINDTNGALPAGQCDGPFTVTFAKAYSATPTVTIAANTTSGAGAYIIASVYNVTTTGFIGRTCNPSAGSSTQPASLHWIALGE